MVVGCNAPPPREHRVAQRSRARGLRRKLIPSTALVPVFHRTAQCRQCQVDLGKWESDPGIVQASSHLPTDFAHPIRTVLHRDSHVHAGRPPATPVEAGARDDQRTARLGRFLIRGGLCFGRMFLAKLSGGSGLLPPADICLISARTRSPATPGSLSPLSGLDIRALFRSPAQSPERGASRRRRRPHPG